jgi:hypothetical protein
LEELQNSQIRKFLERYPPRPPPIQDALPSIERFQPLLFPGMYERW